MRVLAPLVLRASRAQHLKLLGLGGIANSDIPALAPLSSLRQLMLEPLQEPVEAGAVRGAGRGAAQPTRQLSARLAAWELRVCVKVKRRERAVKAWPV
jgi:hypothetical protein